MKPDDMKEFLDKFGKMAFKLDKEKQETSFTSVIMRTNQEFGDMLREFHYGDEPYVPPSFPLDYNLAHEGYTLNNRYGSLLLNFIQTDFSSLDGFKSFIMKWGFAGFLDINPDFDAPPLDSSFYTTQEVKEIFLQFYEGTHEALIQAQHDFRTVIDYCLDVREKPALEPLNFQERYLVGSMTGKIPSLDVYSKDTRVLHSLDFEPEYTVSFLSLEDLVEMVAKEKPNQVIEYHGLDIRTFVYHEFFAIIDDLLLRKCHNCGSYFVAKHKISEMYCEACRNVSYSTKIKGDPLRAAYSTAYKTRHREKQRRIQMFPEDLRMVEKWEGLLETWVKNAKKNLKAAQNGDLTIEEFTDLLKIRLEDIKDGH